MKRLLASAACGLLLLCPLARRAAAQRISNPDLFLKSQQAAFQALEYYGRYDNPKELKRVARIGYRLAQESTFRDFPFTFYLVDMPVPNAFALPGGQIFLTKGMLDLGLNDDMLAGLLGHEIGHVVLDHGMRMKRRATLLNVLSQALLVGVVISASHDRQPGGVPDPYGRGSSSGDLIQGTAAAGAVVSELLLRSYSREFEDEADEEGQRLAAGAGFDPDGTRQLMDKMRTHMPETREYGYWRTHPFFEERVRAATVRKQLLKIQPPKTADPFRTATQAALLNFVDRRRTEPKLTALLKEEALLAWPLGPAADAIRLERLRTRRERELEKNLLSQDLRGLIRLYQENLDELRALAPKSPLIATLSEQIGDFEARLDELYPQAVETFRGGIYETEFLETFANNWGDAPEGPEVSLALGHAFSRLGRQSDAVTQYLEAWRRAPDQPAGRQARAGLRQLAPYLNQLGALEQLASRPDDRELQRLASERLRQLASEYDDLANGAAYLSKYPNGREAKVVAQRLNRLAEKLYGELVLYQTVGDHLKGIERIQKILTYAPDSPAADRLRARMVVEG